MGRPASARPHLLDRLRRARTAGTLSLLALLAVTGAQLSAAWHEMTVRHVVCADHGEMTHVRIGSAPAANASAPSGGAGAQNPATSEGHEHCALALIVRGNTPAPARATVARALPPPTVVAPRAPMSVLRPGRTFVLASAPKTSPPAA
jgi:hypothetical protein